MNQSRRIFLVIAMILASFAAVAKEVEYSSDRHIKISVGIYVASLYDINIPERKFTVSAWIWSTYDPELLPDDYKFFNKIEITNARTWSIGEKETFTVRNDDGTVHTMAKLTAEINQAWDTKYFPFDRQDMTINIESVELDSKQIEFVPDTINSIVGDELILSGWNVLPVQARSLDYKYPTTFGMRSGAKGIYPRISFVVPILRDGQRIFWTYFLGFFVSYIIICILYFFGRELIESRVGLIMTALFACVGNKYTVDLSLPTNDVFALSDLIQVASFAVVGMGLLGSVMLVVLMKKGMERLAYKVDVVITWIVALGYPAVMLYGVSMALGWV